MIDTHAWFVRVLQMDLADQPDGVSPTDLLDTQDARKAQADRLAEARAMINAGAPNGAGGAVAYARMRLRWNAAKASHATARANLVKVVSALLDGEEYADEPRLDEARTAAATVAGRIPSFGELQSEIDDALDALASTPPDQRSGLQANAARAIQRYRASLDADPMLRELQYTHLGQYSIVDEIDAALLSLQAALAE